jgi:hypothetical protein
VTDEGPVNPLLALALTSSRELDAMVELHGNAGAAVFAQLRMHLGQQFTDDQIWDFLTDTAEIALKKIVEVPENAPLEAVQSAWMIALRATLAMTVVTGAKAARAGLAASDEVLAHNIAEALERNSPVALVLGEAERKVIREAIAEARP